MNPQGNLENGNYMTIHMYIFQAMYPNKCYIFGIVEINYDKLECSQVYPNVMSTQVNLRKGNPIAVSMYIFHVMCPNKCYIFVIIDSYFEFGKYICTSKII